MKKGMGVVLIPFLYGFSLYLCFLSNDLSMCNHSI